MIYLPQKTPIVKFLKNSLILTPSLINFLTGLRTDGDEIPLEVVNWSQVPSYLGITHSAEVRTAVETGVLPCNW